MAPMDSAINTALSANDIERYQREGYLCPVDVFAEADAARLRSELEDLERRVAGNATLEAAIRNNSNWVVPWFDEIARTPGIVESVAGILGPDILAIHVDLFIKEPHTEKFISWHQDLHYWGLDSDDEVTAWLALSPATPESGCMRFVPGSHKSIVNHKDTFGADNMLSRGQELAVEVDEDEAIFAALKPGQMSLHHGRMFHSSGPNRSDDRRIGIAIRYVNPAVGLASGDQKLGASLVRGQDDHGHFELMPPPTKEFEPAAMQAWQRLKEAENAILYAGAAHR